MGILILISLGVVVVLLTAYIGKKLGRTMPGKEKMHPWEDDEVVPGWEKVKRDLDNDPHVIGSAARSSHEMFNPDD